MSAWPQFVVKMPFVSTSPAATIVGAKVTSLATPIKFVRKKMMRNVMTCAKIKDVVPMLFAILASACVLQDSRGMIHMMLLLGVRPFLNVPTIPIVGTTKYVPFCPILFIGNVWMLVQELTVVLMLIGKIFFHFLKF